MIIFAHRGLISKYPENTLQALIESHKRGFATETDVRLTKDKEYVLIHDSDLRRLCGVDTKVNELSLNEIHSITYKASSQYNIPSLEEYFMKLSDYKDDGKYLCALHVKEDTQTEFSFKNFSNIFKKYNLYKKIFLFDLTIESTRLLKKIDPNIDIAITVSDKKFEPTVYQWEEVKDEKFEIVWAAEFRNLYQKEFIESIKNNNKRLIAVSPDVHKHPHLSHPKAHSGYKNTWKDLIKWSVDGICTDHPDELKDFMHS